MTLRHIILFRFNQAATAERVAALSAGLDSLTGSIGQIRSYTHGRDAGVRDGSWDYGIVAEFASVEDFHAYREHPDHQALVRDLLDPITVERASVQIAD